MSRPPLWEVMRAADSSCASDFTSSEARAITAVRDWLVPEEPPPHRGMRPGGTNLTYRETLSVERQRLRALLTAEAERAERGEGTDD